MKNKNSRRGSIYQSGMGVDILDEVKRLPPLTSGSDIEGDQKTLKCQSIYGPYNKK